MELAGLLNLLRDHAAYRAFLGTACHEGRGLLRAGLPALSLELLEAARPFFLAALQQDWPGPLLVLAGKPEDARHLAEETALWSAQPDSIRYFQAPDTVFYDRGTWDRETVHARVSVLAQLATLESGAGRGLLVTASIWALMTKSISPMAFRRATRTLGVGDVIPLYRLLDYLARAGYESVPVVERPGTFSHRGSIVDVYPPNRTEPVRIDFFGDEIDSIRTFDPGTQRSIDTIRQVTIAPASEALPEWGKAAAEALRRLDLASCNSATRQRMAEEREQLARGTFFEGIEHYLPYLYPRPSTLLDFMPDNALLLIDDMVTLETAAMNMENQALGLRNEMIEDGQLPPNFAVPYLTWEELKARLASRRAVSLGYGLEQTPGLFGESFIAAPKYGGHLDQALADMAELQADGQRVVVVSRQAERLADLLRERRLYITPTETLTTVPEPGTISLVDGILAEGWAAPAERLVLLTDAEVFGWLRMRRRRPPRPRREAPESAFAELEEGDYVVHMEYGIGRYHGMVRKRIGDLDREYMEIEYAAGDRLYVPVHQADRVSRYIGADEREPHLHRLGTAEWATVRARAEKAVRDIALELLELYAAREVTPGHAFAPDNEWQRELEASFPYQETEDQLRALAEIKRDMEAPKPMDRLICGDVGYGKTEVALRAAFKAVMDGKQVAMLVPTTVLAQQHFYTFRRRLRAFPVTVEMLSRFVPPQEQERILEGLRSGRVDIVIGTHRLLSGDVAFKDLGLVIIDEEQRFGVSHKEHLKRIRREVDVLTLTATPIPRTLYMALSGIRDMSIIDTPPEDRLGIRTFVSEFDEGLIRKAILRELDRGGQVYFVHNRVYDIDEMAARLARIVPEASIVVGHGQMDEEDLAQIMLGFAQGEYDILLCTTIIESGLDIPNVNTIIIDRADTFGLAQLYQLRGRVGRGVNRARAYLLYKPPLTDIARKRLQTIQEASELGAGFRIAMRDMEIRGAGEILGAEQSGQIAAIGFDLYTRLLQQAVEELREASGESINAIRRAQHATAASMLRLDLGPSIDLPVSAYLPDEFIPDEQLRLRLYRRLARVEREDEIDDIVQELHDRFGELPEPVLGLLYVLRVRLVGADAGVTTISSNPRQVVVALPLPLEPNAASRLESRYRGVTARGTRVWLPLEEGWQTQLLDVLRALARMELVPA
ncbi:MAG: transcription-repair coupling factor [Chloroflexi bacterium]|nr:transcription-repair coupling factor [Chloroflexota bacterium]